MAGIRVALLGPLSVTHDGVAVIPTAAKPRQLLALLLLNDGETVPIASLVSELWDDTPPRSALTTLQTYVLQLRKEFAKIPGMCPQSVARDLLQTRHGGYLINLGGAEFDLHEYRTLVDAGNRFQRADDPAGVVVACTRALGLWQGAALADVDQGRFLRAETAQLEQSRLTTLETLFDAQLRLQRHREVLSELAAMVVQHPLHEHIHAQYMLALHRSGHRARALEVFGRLRGELTTELGIEPSPLLRWLHRAILASDSSLSSPEFRLENVVA